MSFFSSTHSTRFQDLTNEELMNMYGCIPSAKRSYTSNSYRTYGTGTPRRKYLPPQLLQRIKMIQDKTKHRCNIESSHGHSCQSYGTVDLNMFPNIPLFTLLIRHAANQVGVKFEPGQCCKICKNHAKLVLKVLLNSCRYKLTKSMLELIINGFLKTVFGGDVSEMAHYLTKIQKRLDEIDNTNH